MHHFTVYEIPYPKMRLGRIFDGGYVFAQLPITYNLFLSLGTQCRPKFEDHFTNMHKMKGILVADRPRLRSDDVLFFRNTVSSRNERGHVNMYSYIKAHSQTFLKIDLNGGEWNWLEHLPPNHIDNVQQLVINVKGLNRRAKRRDDIIKKLFETHRCINVNPDNRYSSHNHKIHGFICPNRMAMTWVHRRWFEDTIENHMPIPKNLDRRMDPNKPHFRITWPPFCYEDF